MNKRIDELIKQSYKMADVEILGEIVNTAVFDEKKFAELIVRECVAICNDTNDASYLNGVIAGRKIKQHFGIEE